MTPILREKEEFEDRLARGRITQIFDYPIVGCYKIKYESVIEYRQDGVIFIEIDIGNISLLSGFNKVFKGISF